MGVAEQLESIDHVLLLIAEAGERARGWARELARAGGQPHLVSALELSDRELLAIHRRLWESILAPSPQIEQLVLDADELTQARDESASEASAAAPRLGEVNEAHMAEVEGVLFLMSEARRRAERAARDLGREGAEAHLVEALERAERELETTIDAFFKSTYFHVPKDQLALS